MSDGEADEFTVVRERLAADDLLELDVLLFVVLVDLLLGEGVGFGEERFDVRWRRFVEALESLGREEWLVAHRVVHGNSLPTAGLLIE